MTAEIVPAETPQAEVMPLPSEDMVVLARNPEEMAKAQTQLVTWAVRKVLIEEAALAEAEQNLEHFPFKVVKPQILSNLNKAMTLKLFDEIGVLPGTRKGDPMVIGMINRRDSTYQETTVSFLITWWVDSRDL